MTEQKHKNIELDKLLPCPFCGAKPYINDYHGAINVSCPTRNCSNVYHTQHDAIKAWNTRTPALPQSSQGVDMNTIAKAICKTCIPKDISVDDLDTNGQPYWFAYMDSAQAALQASGLLTEIESLRAEVKKHEWQPIEAAPKGKYVLCLLEGTNDVCNIYIAYCSARNGQWVSEHGHPMNRPTHWMPLPLPPTESTKEG